MVSPFQCNGMFYCMCFSWWNRNFSPKETPRYWWPPLPACGLGLRKSQIFFCFKVWQGILTTFYYTLELDITAFGTIFFLRPESFLNLSSNDQSGKSERFEVPRFTKCHSSRYSKQGHVSKNSFDLFQELTKRGS